MATAEDKKWEAENDCRTLTEAEEIRKDKDRLAKALAMAKEKQAELDTLLATRPYSKEG